MRVSLKEYKNSCLTSIFHILFFHTTCIWTYPPLLEVTDIRTGSPIFQPTPPHYSVLDMRYSIGNWAIFSETWRYASQGRTPKFFFLAICFQPLVYCFLLQPLGFFPVHIHSGGGACDACYGRYRRLKSSPAGAPFIYPDSKVRWANMGPIWGRQDPGGPHVGPMNFAIWVAKPALRWRRG